MAHVQSFNQEPDSLARQDNYWTVYYNKAGVHCHRLIEDFSFYFVLVLFLQLITAPPMVTVASKVYVGREQAASLICEVKGNPTPTIFWSPCYGRNVICNEQYFNISIVQTARANYTCTANNTQGVDSATTLLRKLTLLYTCSVVVRKFAP